MADFKVGEEIVYDDGERAIVLAVHGGGILHCHATNGMSEFDLSVLDVERKTGRTFDTTDPAFHHPDYIDGPSCPHFPDRCEHCNDNGEGTQSGCYKHILAEYQAPSADRPCVDCHGAPEVHGSCNCTWADEVRKEVDEYLDNRNEEYKLRISCQGGCGRLFSDGSVLRSAVEPNVCEDCIDDPCYLCSRDNKGCKLGERICGWNQEVDTRPCIVSPGLVCAVCSYSVPFNCAIGRC